VIEDTEEKVSQTYKGTELRNHYYRYSHYIIISSNHELLAFSILLLLIIGSSSLLNMALTKSSSHFPLLTTDGISVNGEAGPSNINRAYNLAHGPSNYVSSIIIVIGNGKSGLKERLLGSTTSHVATHLLPILIVK
jgi:hypothetical protein